MLWHAWLHAQPIANPDENSAYIVTERTTGETYLLLCRNTTHTGYAYQYPVKFNVESGEYEDVFADATINGKKVKDYEYLKNWEITLNEVKVDCAEKLLEPESQTWKQEQVEIN